MLENPWTAFPILYDKKYNEVVLILPKKCKRGLKEPKCDGIRYSNGRPYYRCWSTGIDHTCGTAFPTPELGPPKVIAGDAFYKLEELYYSGERADLIIADPPYNISHENGNRMRKRNGEFGETDFGVWDNQVSYEYSEFIEETLKLCKKILNPHGSFYLFFDKYFAVGEGISIIQKWGMHPKNIVAWVKPNPVPSLRKNNYMSAMEFILYGVKNNDGSQTFNYSDYSEMKNFIEMSPSSDKDRRRYDHPTAKPVALLERFIEVSSNPGDIVLDPFCGRGSTLIAAIRRRRNCIGIELDGNYVKKINKWKDEEIDEEPWWRYCRKNWNNRKP